MVRMMANISRVIFTLSALTLFGCGGGGSDSPKPTPAPKVSAKVGIYGVDDAVMLVDSTLKGGVFAHVSEHQGKKETNLQFASFKNEITKIDSGNVKAWLVDQTLTPLDGGHQWQQEINYAHNSEQKFAVTFQDNNNQASTFGSVYGVPFTYAFSKQPKSESLDQLSGVYQNHQLGSSWNIQPSGYLKVTKADNCTFEGTVKAATDAVYFSGSVIRTCPAYKDPKQVDVKLNAIVFSTKSGDKTIINSIFYDNNELLEWFTVEQI